MAEFLITALMIMCSVLVLLTMAATGLLVLLGIRELISVLKGNPSNGR